ncbi:hypothetical protein [Paraburkholderia tagetis]|uniref:Uncharacterized protein n=1 Tax=Paraburkholderia tagetis TaxID=2913261 RepID=A0A9X1UK26_9BURK|nr:hypothetical protein [Paraburkholderia tagetis]MCG5071921.1 hypothetical protein [Paraburkholderia tagetis]
MKTALAAFVAARAVFFGAAGSGVFRTSPIGHSTNSVEYRLTGRTFQAPAEIIARVPGIHSLNGNRL